MVKTLDLWGPAGIWTQHRQVTRLQQRAPRWSDSAQDLGQGVGLIEEDRAERRDAVGPET